MVATAAGAVFMLEVLRGNIVDAVREQRSDTQVQRGERISYVLQTSGR